MEIGRAMEDYLKVIYILSRHNQFVRSVDIATYMKLSKPSVCSAVKLLREKGYLKTDTDKHLKLTQTGEDKARLIHEKYQLIEKLLTDIGVDSKTAITDACKMEHILSKQTIELLSKKITGNLYV